MELDALKFTVETTALDDAITKVGTLQLAVKKLGSDTGSQSARQAAKEQAQITLDQVKAETALIEARGKQARAIENLNSPQEKLTKSVRDSNAVLERQERIYENMISYGLSKGQASTLAMAQAQDIAAESAQKLVGTMKDIHKYIGGEAFDKSTAGMDAMRNRYDLLVVAAKNYADGSVLNIKQAQELALDTERLSARNAQLGLSATEAASRISLMTDEFKTLAAKENELIASNKAYENSIKELNKARQDEEAWIKRTNKELENSEAKRINSIAKDFEDAELVKQKAILRTKAIQESVERKYELTNSLGFSKSEASAIYNFEQQIKKTGETLDVSKAKVEAFMASIREPAKATADPFAKEQALKAKAVEKSANDQAKALAKADEMLARLQNRTKEMSKESPVSATAANQLYAYEKALKAAGVGATEATARLAVFRAEQQKVSQLARSEETLRMQHLSRALAPQVTDVTVGLMTGQNPFTVFLQQGGQIRDQIGLSEVAVENLGKVFKDTFVMMGAMVVAMGKAIYAFFTTPTGAAVLALSALALGVYEVVRSMISFDEQSKAIAKAIYLTGNAAGTTVLQVREMGAAVSTLTGISYTKSTEAVTALAATGKVMSEEFVKAAESAVLLERYAGISISETAKVYANLSKEPLKAVIKLNEETGLFTATQIRNIAETERAGDVDKAAAYAKEYYADATKTAANKIKGELSALGLVMDEVGKFGDLMWDRLFHKGKELPIIQQIDTLKLRLKGLQFNKDFGGTSLGNLIFNDPALKETELAIAKLENLKAAQDKQMSEDKAKTTGSKATSAQEKLISQYIPKVDQRETDRLVAAKNLADQLATPGISTEDANKFKKDYDDLMKFISLKDKKAKSESTEAFSINLSNELQQYEKQYGIEIKLQDDFIRQEKARLDNALAAKEITQGEFNARDLAASERGYTDRQSLSDKYYSGIISANEKNISEMVQQYQEWVNQEGGTPKFFEQNEKALETLRSKIINTNNETSVFLEKIQASAASAKENAFTRYSKQLSILQGEIRGVTLAYNEYLQSEANLTKQKQAQVALEDKVRFATPEQALAIKAAADETDRLTKYVQDYDKQIVNAKMSLDAAVDVYLEQVSLTGEVTEQTQILLNKETDRYNLLLKTKGLIESSVADKVTQASSAATLKYQKDQMKALSDSIAGAIEVGLYEGGDAGSKALRKIIEAELRKPITLFIQAVVGSITGAATSSLTGNSSVGDKLGSLGQAFNGAGLGSFAVSQMGQNLGLSGPAIDATGGLNVSAGNVPTAAGEVFSSLPIGGMLTAYQVGGAKGFAMGVASTAIAGGVAAMAAGTSALAGATLALTQVPGYGWAAMAALAVLGAGGGFTSASSTGYSNKVFSETGAATDRLTTSAGAGNIVDALYAGYAQKAESLGITKAAARFSFSSNTGREGQNPNFTIQASAGGKDYVTQTDNPGLFGANEIAMNDANMQLQANRAILTALQGSELPKYLKGAFDTLVTGSMDSAAINATFEAASALKLFHDQLQLLPFESLKDLSYTATEALKTFSGGLEALSTNLGTYYDKFYSEEEKTALLTKNTKKAFEDLGQVMPMLNDSTRANYRALVDELAAKDLSIAKNAAAYAGVLQLSGAIDKLAPSLTDSAAAITEFLKSGESIYKWLKNLNTSALGLGSPQEQLTASKSSYISSLSGSRLGDKNSLSNLTEDAESYLQAAMDISSTQQQYKAILAQVKTEVSNVPAVLSYQQQLVTSANTALVLAQQQNALLYSIASSTASLAGTPAPSLLSNTATGGATLVTSGVSSGVNSAQVQATSDLVLAAIRDELIGMRYEVRAGVEAGTKTAKILTRVSRDGEEVQVQTGAVFNLPA